MGNFNEQISRMKTLMTYGAVNENKEQRSGSMEYHAVGADGKSYGIIRENAKYYIKVAPQSKEKIAEAYEYIGGFNNRKDYEYTSYSNALKQFELKMMSLNEAYSARVNVETLDPFKKEDVIIEGTKKMKDEIARQRQIMNNVNALMNESSTIKVGNTGVPEAPKTTSFSDKIGEPFNQTATATLDKDLKKTSKKPASMGEPFGDGKKAEQPKDAEYVPQGSVANQKPKGGKVARVNEDCEKDEWGSCGLPGKEGVGSPDGHLMEDDDIAGIADDNFEANDDDLDDVEGADFEGENSDEDLYQDDEDLDDEDLDGEDDSELDDDDIDGEDDDELGDDDLDGEDDELGDDEEDDDFDFDEDFEDGEDGNLDDDLDGEDDELGDDEDLEGEDDELGDDEDEDFGVDDDEMGSDEFEEEFDPEKDAQYDDFDFDAADAEDLEDEGDLDDLDDDEDFDDDEDLDDEDLDDDEDFDDDDEDFDDEDLDDDEDFDDDDDEEVGDDADIDSEIEGDEDLDDDDYDEDLDGLGDDEDDDFGISEARKRELRPIIESIVKTARKNRKINESKKNRKKVNEEGTRLNDFGKHPGYRKKPMTLPETGSDTEGQNRDWNDESAHNEQPFGQKIGSSAPFTKSPEFKAAVDRVTENVMSILSGKKKR